MSVTAVYVYREKVDKDDDHLEIHWTLPVHSEKTGESWDNEIVVLKKEDDDDRDDNFCLLGTHVGMSPPKRQIFVDSFPFEEPKRRAKPKKSTTPRKPTTRKPKAKQKTTSRKKTTTKAEPQPRKPRTRVEPTPEQVEARKEKRQAYNQRRSQTPERKEYNRHYAQDLRQKARELGRCRDCTKHTAIPGQTRCPECAENHRQSRRRSDAKRRASANGTR